MGALHTPGTAALTLWEDEDHGHQREDPMGTSRHVSRAHGGQLPKLQGQTPAIGGTGRDPPLFPALHPAVRTLRFPPATPSLE